MVSTIQKENKKKHSEFMMGKTFRKGKKASDEMIGVYHGQYKDKYNTCYRKNGFNKIRKMYGYIST